VSDAANSGEDFYDEEDGGDLYDEAEPDENEEGGEEGNEDDPDRVVVSGDVAAAGQNKAQKPMKDRKIPNDDRTTTPYMTKYEKARILGTRALQIRFVRRTVENRGKGWGGRG
jgi:DNA-directed RNA polymerases I, II, and III subunit RPABC2